MRGHNKFNENLRKVYDDTNIRMPSVHIFVSISAIGYAFAKTYVCFDGCYELSGKPQDFVLRCASEGRTMTASNKEQYIEDRIQDFDARRLYPSAISIMPGIPLGRPKIIQPSDDLMKCHDFYVEIDIKSMKCKNEKPYDFGLVFKPALFQTCTDQL